jgi:hypothetical protein
MKNLITFSHNRELISSNSFVDCWDNEFKELIRNEYEMEKWFDIIEKVNRNAKHNHTIRSKISKNAYKVGKKVYEDLKIELFPVIHRIYGWGDSYSFWMYEPNENIIYFNDPMKYIRLGKKYEFTKLIQDQDLVLFNQLRKK